MASERKVYFIFVILLALLSVPKIFLDFLYHNQRCVFHHMMIFQVSKIKITTRTKYTIKKFKIKSQEKKLLETQMQDS